MPRPQPTSNLPQLRIWQWFFNNMNPKPCLSAQTSPHNLNPHIKSFTVLEFRDFIPINLSFSRTVNDFQCIAFTKSRRIIQSEDSRFQNKAPSKGGHSPENAREPPRRVAPRKTLEVRLTSRKQQHQPLPALPLLPLPCP